MGMYTEIFFRAELKEDTPRQVLDVLEFQCNRTDELVMPSNLPDHEFFRTDRWAYIAQLTSVSFPKLESVFEKDPYSQKFLIGIHAHLKNYGEEIEKFFDWIDPYVDAWPGYFLGFSVYEESRATPKLFFKRT